VLFFRGHSTSGRPWLHPSPHIDRDASPYEMGIPSNGRIPKRRLIPSRGCSTCSTFSFRTSAFRGWPNTTRERWQLGARLFLLICSVKTATNKAQPRQDSVSAFITAVRPCAPLERPDSLELRVLERERELLRELDRPVLESSVSPFSLVICAFLAVRKRGPATTKATTAAPLADTAAYAIGSVAAGRRSSSPPRRPATASGRGGSVAGALRVRAGIAVGPHQNARSPECVDVGASVRARVRPAKLTCPPGARTR
jgi:hypothetical protein